MPPPLLFVFQAVNVENLCEDPVFQEMFAEIGIDSIDLKENKETQQAIYDFIEKAGWYLLMMKRD